MLNGNINLNLKKGKEQWVGNNRVKILKANPENYYLFRISSAM